MNPLLKDLVPRKRRERIELALAAALDRIELPTPTSEIVQLVAEILHATDEKFLIAGIIDDLKRGHKQARETDQTFTRYGRLMHRWEWLPPHRRRTLTPEETAARRQAQATAEAAPAAPDADDEWTVQPDEEYLEG